MIWNELEQARMNSFAQKTKKDWTYDEVLQKGERIRETNMGDKDFYTVEDRILQFLGKMVIMPTKVEYLQNDCSEGTEQYMLFRTNEADDNPETRFWLLCDWIIYRIVEEVSEEELEGLRRIMEGGGNSNESND